ncbi:MAG: hypothetical protein HWE26_22135 [Alteromonadaceae bacterium]|nr:hypothetical protein [Alteromonadaceae bacterium]
MDINNQRLKELLHKTDIAFQALMEEPGSQALQTAYDQSKQELDYYVGKVRDQLQDRQRIR